MEELTDCVAVIKVDDSPSKAIFLDGTPGESSKKFRYSASLLGKYVRNATINIVAERFHGKTYVSIGVGSRATRGEIDLKKDHQKQLDDLLEDLHPEESFFELIRTESFKTTWANLLQD